MIKRSEAQAVAMAAAAADIAKLEKEVDRLITTGFSGITPVSVPVGIYNRFVIEHIKKIYQEAGWTITEDNGDSKYDEGYPTLRLT